MIVRLDSEPSDARLLQFASNLPCVVIFYLGFSHTELTHYRQCDKSQANATAAPPCQLALNVTCLLLYGRPLVVFRDQSLPKSGL